MFSQKRGVSCVTRMEAEKKSLDFMLLDDFIVRLYLV